MKKNPYNWPFVRGIHRSPVNSPHKGKWRGALMLCLICAWINGWVNNREASDLRRHRAHYDVNVMKADDGEIIFSIKHTSRCMHLNVGKKSMKNLSMESYRFELAFGLLLFRPLGSKTCHIIRVLRFFVFWSVCKHAWRLIFISRRRPKIWQLNHQTDRNYLPWKIFVWD